MSFDPTPEAKDLFSTLNSRWNALFSWGVDAKLPSRRSSADEWVNFAAAWMAEREQYAPAGGGAWLMTVPSIGAHANELASVEQEAEALGFVPAGMTAAQAAEGGRPVIPGSNIDVTQTTEEGKAAQKSQEQAAAVAEAAAKAKAEAERAAASLWSSIPWYVKLGGAAVGVAIIVNAARR